MTKEIARLGIIPGTVCLVQDPKDANNFLIAAKAFKYSKNTARGKQEKFVDSDKTGKVMNIFINTRHTLGNTTVYGTIGARSSGKDFPTVALELDKINSLVLPTNKFLQSIPQNIADNQSVTNYQIIIQHSNNMLATKEFTAASLKASAQKERKVVSYDEMSDTDDEDDVSVSSQLQSTSITS